LSPEHIGQLFQSFNRLGQEAGEIEGTGIGLVVSKRLVELMKGTIGVESRMGEGSIFWFELGTHAEPLIPIATADTTSPYSRATGSEHIHPLLYVEDNPANLHLVEQILARHPEIHLLTAKDGNSGIEIARLSQPEVILMDINLPDISGIQALKLLRGDPLTAHIPVIAVSANAMPLDIEMGMRAGFISYITKPIKVDEFMLAINSAIEYARGKSPQFS